MLRQFWHQDTSDENYYKKVLEDFPSTEIWRLQTDGWQHFLGPSNFRDAYYRGMNKGFEYIQDHYKERLSVSIIEELYQSAYQFENEYRESKIVRKGLRDQIGGGFEIFLSVPGLANDAGISEEGFPEFVEALIQAINDRSQLGGSRWEIRIEIENSSPIAIDYESLQFDNTTTYKKNNKIKFSSPIELSNFLYKHLTNAALSKINAQGSQDYKEPLTKVEIGCPSRYSRKDLERYINDAIKNYYNEIDKLIEQDQVTKKNIVTAIVKLTRSLHQTHCFPDGNGRTFIFLMTNMLLLQNNLGMMITETPSHFAGFSTEQLVSEVTNGLKKSNEYTITNAKNFLQSLSSQKIIKDYHHISTEFEKMLSTDNIIALSQINDIFIKMSNGTIKIPKNYWGEQYNKSFINFLSTSFQNDNQAHNMIMELLKRTYFSKACEVLAFKNNSKEGVSPMFFQDIVKNYQIINDNKFHYKNNSPDKNMRDAIKLQIELIASSSPHSNSIAPT